MDENRTNMQQLAGRIAKLERQNRFWKWGGLSALVLLAMSLVAGVRAQEVRDQMPYRGNTVEAQRFLLKGSNGKVLGEWSSTAGGGAIALYSPDGKVIWSSTPRVQE